MVCLLCLQADAEKVVEGFCSILGALEAEVSEGREGVREREGGS